MDQINNIDEDNANDGGEIDGGEVIVNEADEEEAINDDTGTADDARQNALSEGAVLLRYLRAQGYDEDSALSLVAGQVSLLLALSELNRCSITAPKDEETASCPITAGALNSEMVLNHEGMKALLPYWKKFIGKLASFPSKGQGCITIGLTQMEFGNDVTDMLLQVFATAPLNTLRLEKNGLERTGMKFVLDTIRSSSTLEVLAFERNVLKEKHALALIKCVIDHPSLDALWLNRCGMGRQDKYIMCTIIHALQNLKEISLSGNDLGSSDAEQSEATVHRNVHIIATCLKGNPIVEILSLEDNVLVDIDAAMLAWALKSNSTLRILRLSENRITPRGFRALQSVVDNRESLNGAYESNHTCLIQTGREELSDVNKYMDPNSNRRLKILNLLPVTTIDGPDVTWNMGNIGNIPMATVPLIMASAQALESKHPSVYNGLDATFRLMRHWNMPLLYTSDAGPRLRRSDRIRKREVAQLMELICAQGWILVACNTIAELSRRGIKANAASLYILSTVSYHRM